MKSTVSGPQELRARRIGHLVLSTTTDGPWSHYFSCMVGAHRHFVRQHPVATKRAILKAADICATDPQRAAGLIASRGYTGARDYAAQDLRQIPYARWREYDPEDTVRFYALRLHEVGMIESSPQKLIAHGTDWRALHELKKELKG